MFKVLFNQIITFVIILASNILLGYVLPTVLFDITIPSIFIFTWFIAPIVGTITSTHLLKFLKTKVNIYIIISFTINFIYILIYTWIESRKPHIQGDFLDFRGLLMLISGWGQIVGIGFTVFWIKGVKKLKIV